jgi:hypothetical protein
LENAVLLAVFESLGLDILTLKVTLVPPAAGNGITGILTVSDPSETILVVFVQVTVVPICAPHDQPLSVNAPVGPDIVVGNVSTTVCNPEDDRLPALVSMIGNCDRYPVVSGHSGCPIPGIKSGTLADTYGSILHSTAPECVAGAVQKSQLIPNH